MHSMPCCQLLGHTKPVNALAWAPHSSCHLTTAGEDKQTLIWDLRWGGPGERERSSALTAAVAHSGVPKTIEDPILTYEARAEVNQLQWSASHPDWISIAYVSRR
jgi:WD repeat-containing protein 68